MFNHFSQSSSSRANAHLLNLFSNNAVVQLSISVVLVFFAWFFILPTNVCSYSYLLAEAFQVTDKLFIFLSNVAGLLGLLIGGILFVFFNKTKTLLLSVVLILNIFNILLFVVPPQLGLYFMISQYILLGIYVTLATCLFFINTLQMKRYLFTGSILAAVVFITAFFKQGADGVTATSVLTMNLTMSVVVLIVVVLLNLVRAPQPKFIPVANSGRPVLGAFLLLCVYTFILSFSLGYLSNESEFLLSGSNTFSSVLNVIPYIGTILLVFALPMRRYHMGVITYIANALMIVSIAYVDFFNSQTALSGIVNAMMYFAIAINQLFIFDSTLELTMKSRNPSVPISIGLLIFVLGSALGDHTGEMILVAEIAYFDRILITLVALASTILPLLRIVLSKHSTTSIFRINPVIIGPPALASSPDPIPATEPFQTSVPSSIYPQIPNYDTLTNREKEVLDLLMKGYPSEVISATLYISNNTLKRHVQNIYNKLNVHNRAELFKMLHKT